jgi:hypothetical protein
VAGEGPALVDPATALWEIEQIRQLKARYFRLMDTKLWDEWRSLFTDDMRFWNDNLPDPTSRPSITATADAFVRMVSRILSTAVTVHHGHMPEIELTGEHRAKGTWSMYDRLEDPAKKLDFEGYGHYHETYEKGEDGRWRIKDMHLTRLKTTDDNRPNRGGPL